MKITITSITSTFITIILVTFHFHNLPIIFMLMSCLWLTFCMPLCYTINRGIRVHIVYTWRFGEHLKERKLSYIVPLVLYSSCLHLYIVLLFLSFTTRYQHELLILRQESMVGISWFLWIILVTFRLHGILHILYIICTNKTSFVVILKWLVNYDNLHNNVERDY